MLFLFLISDNTPSLNQYPDPPSKNRPDKAIDTTKTRQDNTHSQEQIRQDNTHSQEQTRQYTK